ncbi:MAG: YebC/PmpR family DNA-binding transcriptional regulator [Actinomycetia bacterium]|nr:YebC/PmpR family DNA-binding transcriptional regulator [Actinomycetes bacterium]
MSGHSKWATTKHRKGAQDAKRSALFGKLTRIIYVAAKEGDPNPANNATLKTAIDKAKSYSLPKDKIDAAIAKASGIGANGAIFEEIVYEGYGPAGVPLYVEVLTDNRNRTAADVRSAFSKAGGNLGTSGSVAFQFERRGQILVDPGDLDEDEFMLLVAEAGGEDIEATDEEVYVWTKSDEVALVRKNLIDAGVEVTGSDLLMVAKSPSPIETSEAKKVMRLIERLEESDDVQNVYHTMDLTDEQLDELDSE